MRSRIYRKAIEEYPEFKNAFIGFENKIHGLWIHGYSWNQIADIIGIPKKNIYSLSDLRKAGIEFLTKNGKYKGAYKYVEYDPVMRYEGAAHVSF